MIASPQKISQSARWIKQLNKYITHASARNLTLNPLLQYDEMVQGEIDKERGHKLWEFEQTYQRDSSDSRTGST